LLLAGRISISHILDFVVTIRNGCFCQKFMLFFSYFRN
jgi:hypothetical protein